MSHKDPLAPPTPGTSGARPNQSSDHFDHLESHFFEEGQEGTFPFEDGDFLDPGEGERKWFALSRQFFTGVAVGGACVAILGGLVLGRMTGSVRAARAAPPALSQMAASASSGPTLLPQPTSIVAMRPAEATGQNGEPSVLDSSHTDIVAAAHLPDANAYDAGSAVEPLPPVAKIVPVEKTDSVQTMPPDVAQTVVAPVPPASDNNAQQTCRKAMANKQRKTILTICPDAFAANPNAADIAMQLARIEFDRGRTAQAFDWSKKAISADPTSADAYVFVGEVEQNAGHTKAAKEAYAHYLRLAPKGRYAADLRAVLRSL